jgi:hypothetical protein
MILPEGPQALAAGLRAFSFTPAAGYTVRWSARVISCGGKMIQKTIPLGVACLILGIALLTAGCGQKELAKKTTVPTQGTITYKGAPAAFVMVTLKPVEKGKGVQAHGRTNQDGTFELRTYSNEDPDGAVPGEYKVVLEEFDPVRGGRIPAGSTPTQLPPGELDTGVTVEVTSSGDNLTIDVP